MPLVRVTQTGFDEFTDFDHACRISKSFPEVEWGVLLDHDRAGTGGENTRYPSLAFIAELAGRKLALGRNAPKMALHLCGGEAITDFLVNAESITMDVVPAFDRIQLNFDPSEKVMPALAQAIDRNPNQIIITQHGENLRRNHWRSIESPNHHILFDSSQGQGILPKEWPTPLSYRRHKCSYAGRLGPDNIDEQLLLIDEASLGERYGLCMETSLRDENDRFDPNRSEIVLKKSKPFMLAR